MKTKKQVFYSCHIYKNGSLSGFVDGSGDIDEVSDIKEVRDCLDKQVREMQNLSDDSQIHFLNLNIIDVLDM